MGSLRLFSRAFRRIRPFRDAARIPNQRYRGTELLRHFRILHGAGPDRKIRTRLLLAVRFQSPAAALADLHRGAGAVVRDRRQLATDCVVRIR
jgi:hypothetical protein